MGVGKRVGVGSVSTAPLNQQRNPVAGEMIYTPYADRKNFPLQREKRELQRAAVDVDTLDKVYRGLMRRYEYRESKIKANLKKFFKSPDQSKSATERLNDFKERRTVLDELYVSIRRPLVGIIESKNRIFKDCTPEERAERAKAMLRIPAEMFSHFDNLSSDDQDKELLRLVSEYGTGSKNAGFSPELLNMPGLVNPHTTGNKLETDGSKRRSLLQWEMIDRLIYGGLHPEKYQHIFFHTTDKTVQRWGKNRRQMRSEGRFAMIRVLMVLIIRMDVKASLRSGIYNPKTDMFEGISRADLADAAGISVHAVKHALENLVALNILYPGKQPRESYPGNSSDEPLKWKGIPVVRKFTKLLIAGLSLADLHKSCRAEDKQAGFTKAQLQELRDLEMQGEELGIDVSGEMAKMEALFTVRNYA